MKKNILITTVLLLVATVAGCGNEDLILNNLNLIVETPIQSREDDFSKTLVTGWVDPSKPDVLIKLVIPGQSDLTCLTDKFGAFELELSTPKEDLNGKLVAIASEKNRSKPVDVIIPKGILSGTPVLREPISALDAELKFIIIKGKIEELKQVATIRIEIDGQEPIITETDQEGLFELEIKMPDIDKVIKIIANEPFKIPSVPLEVSLSEMFYESYFNENKDKFYSFRGVFEKDTDFKLRLKTENGVVAPLMIIVVEEMEGDEVKNREYLQGERFNGNNYDKIFMFPEKYSNKDIIIHVKNSTQSVWVKGLKEIINYGEDIEKLNYGDLYNLNG